MQHTCKGNTAESEPLLDIQDIFHQMRRGEYHWICNEPVLVTFHCLNHGSLRRWALVVMNDTNATQELK